MEAEQWFSGFARHLRRGTGRDQGFLGQSPSAEPASRDSGVTGGSDRKSLFGWLWGIAIAICALIALAVSVQLYAVRKANEVRATAEVASVQPEVRVALEKDLVLFETDTRMKLVLGVVQALTGFALLLGLVATWKNLQATHEKLEIDRNGQLTNRFNEAASQLGADSKEGTPNIEARLGGIYSLEWIAKDNPQLFWPVMEILTAYVRHNAPYVRDAAPRKPRTDIQAVLQVLGRSDADCHRHPDDKVVRKFDLRGAKLSHATLCGGNLKNADLTNVEERDCTNFDQANFLGAKIVNADFTRSLSLTQAQIESTSADRRGAKLPGHLHL